MICAIHQPTFLPYLGVFDKIKKADILIIYDDAQFVKRDYLQKNSILLDGRIFRLHVPLVKHNLKEKINKIKINQQFQTHRMNWKEYHLLQIKNAYKKTENFDKIYPLIRKIYYKNHNYLYNLNLDLILLFCKLLGITIRYECSSDISKKFKIKSTSTLKLIEMCKAVKADSYISGHKGKSYIDEELFKKHNINLIYQFFDHPIYKQKSDNFIKNISTIDYLFSNEN